MLTLNAFVQTQMMLNAQVAQIVTENTKKSTNSFLSEGSVFTILHEHLWMRKLCSKWVSRLLIVERKQQRVDDSERCLQPFQRNKREFLRKYVTMDETWIHPFTLGSYLLLAVWTATCESHPKRPKMPTSAGKVLASVFWDAQGILFIDYLEKGRYYLPTPPLGQDMTQGQFFKRSLTGLNSEFSFNSEYHTVLLVRLKEVIAKKKRNKRTRKKCSFTKTMHCVISRSQRWQSYMNCTMNCFSTYPILQIWPPVTTSCLQTPKECSRERDLAPMKKQYRKLRRILWPKTNRSTKKASNCLRSVGINVSP